MNTKDLLHLGVPLGAAQRRATDFISKFILGGGDKSRLREEVAAIVRNPAAFTDDPLRGDFARALLAAPPPTRTSAMACPSVACSPRTTRSSPTPWGSISRAA